MDKLKALFNGRNRLGLMCFSILWIIAFHYSMYGNLLRFEIFDFLFGKGYLGVDIFFFLSAYGLCFSLEKNDLQNYYLRRISRLYPLYFIYLLVFILVFLNSGVMPWYRFAALQITGLATWFIPALTVLYILFPLIYKVLAWSYRRGFVVSAVIIAGLAVAPCVMKCCMNELFASRLAIIAVGVYSFLALREGNEDFLLKIYLLCAIIGLCYIGSDKLNYSMTGSLLMPAVLYVIAQTGIVTLRFKAIDIIGSHTLEIYLAQNIALNHFMRSYNITFLLKSAIALVIIIAMSFLLYFTQTLAVRLYKLR